MYDNQWRVPVNYCHSGEGWCLSVEDGKGGLGEGYKRREMQQCHEQRACMGECAGERGRGLVYKQRWQWDGSGKKTGIIAVVKPNA